MLLAKHEVKMSTLIDEWVELQYGLSKLEETGASEKQIRLQKLKIRANSLERDLLKDGIEVLE